MLQDKNGIIWIANRKGIVQYDGVNWQLIPTPSAIFSLIMDDEGTIYGSGRNIIGKLSYNESNKLFFNLIALDPTIDDIISSSPVENGVIFLTKSRVHFYNSSLDSIQSFLDDSKAVMRGLFKYRDGHLISAGNGTLYRLSNNFNELIPYEDFDSLTNYAGVRSITQYADSSMLISIIDNDGNLYINDELGFKPLNFDDEDYIKSSIPIETKWVTTSLLAISTLSGGVVFVDPSDSSSVKIVNYHTGLPDNQVFAISSDLDYGIWVAHDYGLTRIAPLMPFKSYGNFPGLDGNILAIYRFNEKIYVGTNLGVYYLDEVEDYNEVEYFVRKITKAPQETEQVEVSPNTSKKASTKEEDQKNITKQEEEAEPTDEKKKKGLFRFLKKKKNKDEQIAQIPAQTEDSTSDVSGEQEPKPKTGFLNKLFKGQEQIETTNTNTKIEWQKRTKRELLSIRYLFKKIPDIPAKTQLLIPAKDMLLAAGLSGIHQIENDEAIQITDLPIRHAHFSENNNILFASTFEDEVLSFSYESGTWVPGNLLEGLNDYVFQIMEQESNIWLVSADSLYHIQFESEEIVDVEVFQINNPYFEETYAVNHDGSLFFINSSGYYYYEPYEREIIEAEGLKEVWGNAERLFVGGGKNIWMFNGKVWNTLGENTFDHENYDFLNLFPDIRQLYYSEELDRFWIVTSQNKIFEISPPKNQSLQTHTSIYLKEIRQQNSILLPDHRLNIELENSSLTFSFIQPDYSGLLGIEYQYRLVGLTDNWSEWNQTNNTLTFSYLPAGQYKLEFQTRDIFGTLSSINPIEFKIIDPYWRRPWFYAVEVVVFGLLLFLSIRLNRANTRYRIISRLLAFLTLILIIEFIQTIAEYQFETNASPVIDFFIQVSVALAVLPFESLLRRAMFRSQQDSAQAKLAKSVKTTQSKGKK